MKRCPTCQRTYASDDFTFCLDDGALLSAPYDAQQGEPTPSARRSEPPATEVLPSQPNPTVASVPESKPPVIPTMAVKTPPPAPQREPIASRQPVHSRKRFRVIYVVGPLALLMIIIAVVFVSALRCPTLTLYCSPGDNLAACVLDGPSYWHRRIMPQSVTWGLRTGRIIRSNFDEVVIDTTGFAGKEITITATYETGTCSTTTSKTFVAAATAVTPSK